VLLFAHNVEFPSWCHQSSKKAVDVAKNPSTREAFETGRPVEQAVGTLHTRTLSIIPTRHAHYTTVHSRSAASNTRYSRNVRCAAFARVLARKALLQGVL
jgi:hypothetical protein